MKVVFRIAEFDESGKLTLLEKEFETYPEAEKGIEELKNGTYQVQKVFVKKDEVYEHSAKQSNSTEWMKTKTFA